MNLKQHLGAVTALKVTESDAVTAGDVAGCATPLLSSIARRNLVADAEKFTSATATKQKTKKKRVRLAELMSFFLNEEEQQEEVTTPHKNDFDEDEVTARLKSFEDKEKVDHRDTVTFGLEDENKNLVRVTIGRDKADEFEKYLNSTIGDVDNNGKSQEIAEILFKARDQFDIVDVEWPDIEEDEEEAPDLEGITSPEENQSGDDQSEASGLPPEDQTLPPQGDDQAASVLTQVIDMMKADASARHAEAKAREAEARAKEAAAVVQQAMTKVKQEEQYLDMESHEKAAKTRDKEARRLAQLAKWKHDLKQGNSEEDLDEEGSVSAEENEEISGQRRSAFQKSGAPLPLAGRVTTKDIADIIARRAA